MPQTSTEFKAVLDVIDKPCRMGLSGVRWPSRLTEAAALTEAISPRPPRSRTLRLWLIIGTIVAALAIIPAAMMGMFSVMASDAGVTPLINLYILTSLTFPLAVIIGPAAAWIAFWLRRERTAWVLLFSPFAWVVAIVVLLVMASNGAS
ncbi:hypothetical protein BH10PSE1_BH10PSE1_16430 [soil metagenome]